MDDPEVPNGLKLDPENEEAPGNSSAAFGNRENIQGPYWKVRLKPVKNLEMEDGESSGEDSGSESPPPLTDSRPVLEKHLLNLVPRNELMDSKIREKLKAMPVWKKELVERKKKGPLIAKAGVVSAVNSQAPAKQWSKGRLLPPHPGESDFTRQVVNKQSSPGIPRKRVSPSNSFNKGGRRTPSPNSVLEGGLTPVEMQKKVDRVRKARLYLLQQMGPNSFLIGGDSPEHKYKVIIGPQTCSCNRGHCMHLLFVMLRVFQVSENDVCLWSKELKNYEVENLFRNYHHRRISLMRAPKSTAVKSEENNEGSLTAENSPSSSDSSTKDEEETCPICLLEMIEGESIVKCEAGCQNKLHHHCITIWFELCHRQRDPLMCPLCRAQWKAPEAEGAVAPPNTRAPSPGPQEEVTLPHAEPLSAEFTEIAQPWIEALGEELVCCVCSKNWAVRETGLKRLGREAMSTLQRGSGDVSRGANVSQESLMAKQQMLSVCCQILAMVGCADPVYKVFVGALKTLRCILSYTPCRNQEQQQNLQQLLVPVINGVLLKCADGNRRTSQLSLSTIVELARGQAGELAIGREIVNPGTLGLGGVQFIVDSVVEDYDPAVVQWQWLLGRLCMLDRLVEEFPLEFTVAASESGDPVDWRRSKAIVKFSLKAAQNTHNRISKVAVRVFLITARSAVQNIEVYKQIQNMIQDIVLDHSLLVKLKKKLMLMSEENRLLSPAPSVYGGDALLVPASTAIDSPYDTPRTVSPTDSALQTNAQRILSLEAKEVIFVNENDASEDLSSTCSVIGAQSSTDTASLDTAVNDVPPNTPVNSILGSPVDASSTNVFPLDTETKSDAKHNEANDTGQDRVDIPKIVVEIVEDIVSASIAAFQKETAQNNSLDNKHNESTEEVGLLIDFDTESDENSPAVSIQDTAQGEENNVIQQQTEELSDKNSDQENVKNDHCHENHSVPPQSTDRNLAVTQQLLCTCTTKPCNCDSMTQSKNLPPCICTQTPCECHKDLNLLATPPKLGVLVNIECSCKTTPCESDSHLKIKEESNSSPEEKRLHAYHSSTNPSTSFTEDLSELTLSPATPEDKLVSFKTEVAAASPRTSPESTQDNDGSKDEECHCKEEVEIEEAQALVAALEASNKQDVLPVIPALGSRTDKEITIHIQGENSTDSKNGHPQPHVFLEGVHWIRGPLIGTGAFSTCYQARDVKSGTIMAVKQISFCRNSSSEQAQVVEAIEDEIYMMARLNHPNVVRILGATQQGCHFNMFVEWMPGGSVSNILSVYGAFSEIVIASYTQQVLMGLTYLHDNHVLHRDLKGANILVDSTGKRIRIGDFGASARLKRRATGAGEFQGQLLGTIAFMAPEVLRGESYGRSCDVWSVGCVMIEMATSKPPWGVEALSNHLALIFKIASSVYPPPIPENISPAIRDLMLRCLEPKGQDRPPAKELLQHPLFTMSKKFSSLSEKPPTTQPP